MRSNATTSHRKLRATRPTDRQGTHQLSDSSQILLQSYDLFLFYEVEGFRLFNLQLKIFILIIYESADLNNFKIMKENFE